MTLSDEEIARVLAASDAKPKDLAQLVELAGATPTGDAVGDAKAMAEQLGLEVEDMLYGLFAENEPLFNDDTWRDLTHPWDDEEEKDE